MREAEADDNEQEEATPIRTGTIASNAPGKAMSNDPPVRTARAVAIPANGFAIADRRAHGEYPIER